MTTKNPHHQGNPNLEIKEEDGMIRIAPKDLHIVWGDDDRFWHVPQDDEESPAVLQQVSWLEVRGRVGNVRPEKEYEVGFNVSLTPDSFGWGSSKVFILVKRGKNGKFLSTKLDLETSIKESNGDLTAKIRPSLNNNEKDLHFGLFEVWSGKWKGGLKIHYAFVRQLQN